MLSIPVTTDNRTEITDLTHSVVDGNGVFDQLMKAVNAHLDQEFQKGRIKGTEYSTVYLSAMQGALEISLQFVLQSKKVDKELEILSASKDKELAQIELLKQQTTNLVAEALNIPKQGSLIDAQKDVAVQQKTNAITEGLVLTNQVAKVLAEKELLVQRKVTEQAQTDGTPIQSTSILGKQRDVLTNQANGFIRDSEQKAADIMIKGFSVVATTNDLEVADAGTYGVSPTNISAVLAKLKTGVGA
jgi:endo-beta-N-acetylglucosaminidase D